MAFSGLWHSTCVGTSVTQCQETHHFKYISQVTRTLLMVRSLQVETSFMAKGTNSVLGRQVCHGLH